MSTILNPIQYIFVATILLYLLDSIWEIGSIFRSFSKRLASCFILAGLTLHCAFLLIISIRSGTLPISTLFESSIFYLSLIVLVSVILKYIYKLSSITIFVMPIVTGFSIAAFALVSNDLTLTYDLKKFWLFAHIIPIFLGYAAFTVSFILSVMYLTQERQLKKKAFGPLFESLPSLETLDTLMWKTVTFGFPLLTIGLVSGTIWAKTSNILGELWYLDSKVLLGALTWLIYAALLHLRLGASFHGTKVACVTIGGFIIVILTFIGPFLMGSKHAYDKVSLKLEQKTPSDKAELSSRDVNIAKVKF
ncbi:MAG: cytochrome c biogenesis protein resC [Candidatus Scalindua rubra]|uniref:Cytochrome c biogenesis protein resC n=1 Tax=Candidatus Scalindua rubra TaxID=1872076 RepID=A0A1E3X9M4_9BACT|nr:MAG: cytochrome c biogenesis protein resC [Candidatus Scalindua rubra]